jgi:hypothetical protein
MMRGYPDLPRPELNSMGQHRPAVSKNPKKSRNRLAAKTRLTEHKLKHQAASLLACGMAVIQNLKLALLTIDVIMRLMASMSSIRGAICSSDGL